MAKPVAFEGQNLVYSHPDCLDLPVCQQETMLGQQRTVEVVSAWQLTPEELANVNANGGIVFLSVIGGQPPVYVTGINPIVVQ